VNSLKQAPTVAIRRAGLRSVGLVFFGLVSIAAFAGLGCFGSVDYENEYTEQQPRTDPAPEPSPVVLAATSDASDCDDASANCKTTESNNPPAPGPTANNPPPVPWVPGDPQPGVNDELKRN
jgi:hypothetical protein